MRKKVVYGSSDKEQSVKITLLYYLHTFPFKLLNYQQSKATWDETRQANIQSNEPLQLSQFKLVAISLCRDLINSNTHQYTLQ